MKRWAKICIWVGIAWLIISAIGLTIFYFQVKDLMIQNQIDMLAGRDSSINGGLRNIVETINADSPFLDLLVWLLMLAVPSVILFIIVGIWGRENKSPAV